MVHYHSDYITRGNKYKLSNHRFHYDLQSTIFLHVLLIFGIVYLTMLSNVNVNTVNPFKTCYLSKYNFTSDLTGTGVIHSFVLVRVII